MKIVYYTSLHSEPLKSFLYKNFPRRDRRYLDWWIEQSQNIEKGLQDRTFMIVDESKQIVACSTALWTKMRNRSKVLDMYWEGNTIVDPNYRGKGIGRMIYVQMDKFRDRCTTGFTEAAYAIQPKIIKNFKKLSSVYVYISLNPYFIKSLFDRLAGKKEPNWMFSHKMEVNHITFDRVDDIESFQFTVDGFWQNDEVELIRDKDFIKRRFVDIYKKYIIYQAKVKNETVGYFVVRPAKYKGFNLLALVDFRFKNERVHKSIMKAMNIIAIKNRIGMCITLTSLKKKRLSFECTIRMPKVLYGGTTMAELKEDDFILITSADSDLDFVYYG